MGRHNFYDTNGLFEEFTAIRANEINFNDLVETPIMLKMLPELNGKKMLDIGCGMGQHAKQYADLGAASVLGIDISEKLLAIARENYSDPNIEYKRWALEDLSMLHQIFDVVTSSLVFDYVEDFDQLMNDIHQITHQNSELIFSMSHPMVTSYDRSIPRWTRNASGEKVHANLYNYFIEGKKCFDWGGEEIVNYHRTLSTVINSIVKAGFVIVECQESLANEDLRREHPEVFAGTIHRPDFIFFKCRRQ